MAVDTDVIVIGAGVVGLAVARQFASKGLQVIVLERHSGIGQETSSRNSEVVHAGIYYPAGSLRAKLCVRGKELLYDFCQTRSIEFLRCGKLIVATTQAEQGKLSLLQKQALDNGVTDLVMLTRQQLAEIEPAIRGASALLSPSTGIVDSHAFMLGIQAELEGFGGVVVCNTDVTSVVIEQDSILVKAHSLNEPVEIRTRLLINSAGLGACDVANTINGIDPRHVPRSYTAKGSYFAYSGAAQFKRLVYPVPEQSGLGIHATLDLSNHLRFGPDVEWTDEIQYDVDDAKLDIFYEAIRQYWPDVNRDRLYPAYSGIRPKLSGPGQAPVDFLIQGPKDHGCAGLINLFGIESPGLTAALAIGEYVERLAGHDAD